MTQELIAELQEAASAILLENPGIGFDGWVDMLMEQYPAELVDAFGADEKSIICGLDTLWKCECLQKRCN